MTTAIETVATLDRHVQTMAATESVSEVFRVLLEACRDVTPRAAVFLVRQNRVMGWGSVGYSPEVTRQQRTYSTPVGEGWVGRIAASDETVLATRPSSEADPDFGQPTTTEAVGIVVRVKGRPIAVVLAERCLDEFPWAPHAVGTLVTVAQLRLELDLALRKLAETPAAAPTRTPTPAPTAAPVAQVMNSIPEAATAQTSEIAPVTDTPEEENPELKAPRRFARLVATDIRLYNEEAVALGRKNGDLVKRLGDQLGRGKETYLKRHGDLGPLALTLLHEAYVQILAGGDSTLIPTLE